MSARHALWSVLLFTVLAPAVADSSPMAGMMTGSARAADDRTGPCGVGTVVRVDASIGRLVVRHGEMGRLGMPAMTTAFRVRERSLLNGLKAGERIGFRVVPAGDGLVVTALTPNERKCPA